MKRIKKIIVSLIVIGGAVFCVTSADNSDCGTFASLSYSQDSGENGFNIINLTRNTTENKYSNFLTTNEQLAIINKESLNTAMLNLKKYCCENELGGLKQQSETCKKDKVFFNDNALDSPFLFDHLFDVIMRRLVGLTGENDIYMKTDMSVDQKGEERRARILEEAQDITGSNPQTIIDKYQEIWQQSPSSAGYNIKDKIHATFGDLSDDQFLSYVSGQGSFNENDESKQIANAFKNYDKWTLYDRYDNACALTEYFYALLDQGIQSSDKIKTIKRLSNGQCNSIIKDQIQLENSYVREVIQRQSNLFMGNTVKEYLTYLQDRTNTLKDTRGKARDRWLDVVRAVPKLIKKCVK